MPHQSIDNPHQTHRQPVHDMQETIDSRLQTMMRRLVARQPRLPGTQDAISDKRQRPPRAPHHKPEKRRQVISIVNPQQRILQLTEIFTLIAAAAVRRGSASARWPWHRRRDCHCATPLSDRHDNAAEPCAAPMHNRPQQDPEHQQRYVK